MALFSYLDEMFDLVDEHDCVTGCASRREVHARGWRHRAVHVVIHDEQGRIFLQKRSPQKDSFPGCWDCSCTGHVDAGEDYAAAARRELGEELGWHDASPRLRPALKLKAEARTGWEFIQVYLLGPIGGPFALQPDEITEGRWILPRALTAEMEDSPESFSGAFRYLWEAHRGTILALLTGPE